MYTVYLVIHKRWYPRISLYVNMMSLNRRRFQRSDSCLDISQCRIFAAT